MNDINSTIARPEPVVEWGDGDSLPEQSGGAPRTTLLPSIYTFRLPENLAQLWDTIAVKDNRKFLGNGQLNPTFEQDVTRRRLKLDRNAPLVVVGGPHDGEPMTVTWTSAPRPRARGKWLDIIVDPKTAWISDLGYLLDVALGDKSRPASSEALMAAINRYMGKTIRLETGLSAQCRPDKIRYIQTELDGSIQNIQDPSGIKGCSKRFYTKDFKNPDGGKLDQTGAALPAYDIEIACVCGANPTAAQVGAGAAPLPPGSDVVLRGYEQVERFLPALGK